MATLAQLVEIGAAEQGLTGAGAGFGCRKLIGPLQLRLVSIKKGEGMKERVEQIALADIVIDLSIRTREPESFTVSAYRQALRAGAKFPPLVLERGTNRLVCGWHRYQMYRAEYEPTTVVACVFETYPTELDLWKRAISDNIAHGRALDPWDKKRLMVKLQELNADKDQIAVVLGVTIDKLEEWAGMMVVVVGQRDGQVYQERRPTKANIDPGPEPWTEEEYERHVKCETGINARRHAFALTRLIKNRYIDESDEKTLYQLKALYEALGEFLGE